MIEIVTPFIIIFNEIKKIETIYYNIIKINQGMLGFALKLCV